MSSLCNLLSLRPAQGVFHRAAQAHVALRMPIALSNPLGWFLRMAYKMLINGGDPNHLLTGMILQVLAVFTNFNAGMFVDASKKKNKSSWWFGECLRLSICWYKASHISSWLQDCFLWTVCVALTMVIKTTYPTKSRVPIRSPSKYPHNHLLNHIRQLGGFNQLMCPNLDWDLWKQPATKLMNHWFPLVRTDQKY